MTISLDDMKSHLRVTITDDDVIIADKLETAIAWVSQYTGIPPAPVPIFGALGVNLLAPGFAPGDTLTVNGRTITFSTYAPTSTNANGGVINLGTGTVQNVLTAIDQISGTLTPSTAIGGVITLNDSVFGSLVVSSSPPSDLTALGFSATINTTSGTAAGIVVNSQATFPAPVNEAIRQLCGHLYANREASLVGATAQSLPFGVLDLLTPYTPFVCG